MFRISNWKFYFLIALVVRGIMLLYFSEQYKEQFPEKVTNGFVLVHNDYSYHLMPADHYVETGIYSYLNGKTFVGRMPGYSFPYLILRMMFSQPVAVSILVILQFIFSCLSVYLLAMVSYYVFKKERIFYLTFILFLASTFTSIFDLQTISESFSVSSFIAFLYFFASYYENIRKKWLSLVLAGLFLAWAVFLRPYLGLFLMIASLFIYYKESGFSFSQFKSAIYCMFLFVLPFLLVESAWIVRNYNAVGKFVPLEDSMENTYGKAYPKCWLEIRWMIFSWGGEGAYFEKGSEAWWFRRSTELEASTYKFKEHIFKNISSYNMDSLKQLRALYREYLASKDPEREAFLDAEIAKIAIRYNEDFASHNPTIYYIYKPLMGIKRLVFSSGSSYLTLPGFDQMTNFQRTIKLFYSGLYYFILCFGYIGILLCLFLAKHERVYALISAAFIVTLCGIIVFYSEIQEARYFIAAYALLIPFASYFIYFLHSRLPGKK